MGKYRPRLNMYDLEDMVESTALSGIYVGAAIGLIGGIWGGYQVGTAINEYFNINNSVGRGVLDIGVISLLSVPTVSIGAIGGAVVGAVGGTAVYGLRLLGYGISTVYDSLVGVINRRVD